MWKQIAIAGVVGAAVLGSGAVALAETSGGGGTPSAGAATGAKAGALKGKIALALKRLDHGEWVTQGKDGTVSPVTHDAVKGAVSAVSATSITVKSSSGFSETFVVDADTAVRIKGTTGKAAIGGVKVNDTVAVTGIKSGSTVTAKHVLDGGAK